MPRSKVDPTPPDPKYTQSGTSVYTRNVAHGEHHVTFKRRPRKLRLSAAPPLSAQIAAMENRIRYLECEAQIAENPVTVARLHRDILEKRKILGRMKRQAQQ